VSMQCRKFGNTDLVVSEVGFGAWAIGGGAMIGSTPIGWGEADDSISAKAIQVSIDAGINFFDTADIYGLGHSEELLGKTIGKNPKMIIATKVGNVSKDEKFTVDYSKNHIIEACDKSLHRLQRDTIDYYQLHSARLQHLQQGECIEAMQVLLQQGKIRYWGLSLNTFNPSPEADYLMDNGIGHGFQLVLNILNQRSLELVKRASAKGYGIIARMPLQFGLLTGKFDNKASFANNDHRKNRLTEEIIHESGRALEPVWALCEKYNCTKTELALSYVLSYQEVTVVIPGIRTAAQASQDTGGLFKLKTEDRLMIEELGKASLIEIMEMIERQG
jgi:aryl-alcohol dehydrogenase-like predicted oxidoreductase